MKKWNISFLGNKEKRVIFTPLDNSIPLDRESYNEDRVIFIIS